MSLTKNNNSALRTISFTYLYTFNFILQIRIALSLFCYDIIKVIYKVSKTTLKLSYFGKFKFHNEAIIDTI